MFHNGPPRVLANRNLICVPCRNITSGNGKLIFSFLWNLILKADYTQVCKLDIYGLILGVPFYLECVYYRLYQGGGGSPFWGSILSFKPLFLKNRSFPSIEKKWRRGRKCCVCQNKHKSQERYFIIPEVFELLLGHFFKRKRNWCFVFFDGIIFKRKFLTIGGRMALKT